MSQSTFSRKAKDAVHKAILGLGYRVIPLSELPAGRRGRMLSYNGIDLVLDVGANAGQYGQQLRDFGYQGEIISFEPTGDAFLKLARRSAMSKPRGLWIAHKMAIGESKGNTLINVASNDSQSSSLLSMLPAHEQAAPETRNIGIEEVTVETLDGLIDVKPDRSIHLKMDVQGYEDRVLRGAERILAQVKTIECELSLVPLYQGQLLFDDMLVLLRSLGFKPVQYTSLFNERKTGYNFMVDGVFARV